MTKERDKRERLERDKSKTGRETGERQERNWRETGEKLERDLRETGEKPTID